MSRWAGGWEAGVAQCGGAATRDVPRPSWPCSGTSGTPVAGLSTFLTGFSLSDLPIRLPRPHIRYARLRPDGLLMGDRKFTPNSCKIGVG
jgi:hypothetical protein